MAATPGRAGALRSGAQLKGRFIDGVWHCDCAPRIPANHFEVKKDGPNKGKWFRSCQKSKTADAGCKFFLWDTEAHAREAAALGGNSRTELDQPPTTPSKRQSTPRPPYTGDTPSSKMSLKRSRTVNTDLYDEFGIGKSTNSFNDELDRVMDAAETPSKARKTSEFATPSTRRKLPWKLDQSAAGSPGGLQTPASGRKIAGNPFATTPGVSHTTPSKIGRGVGTPGQPALNTPTTGHFTDAGEDDLVQGVFDLLQEGDVKLASKTESDLRSLLAKHTKSAEGYRRGRDVIRATVRAKDAKIAELTCRINTLEAEREAEKAMATHAQWEAEAGNE